MLSSESHSKSYTSLIIIFEGLFIIKFIGSFPSTIIIDLFLPAIVTIL